MSKIKERRVNSLSLDSYPDLHVGDCVPCYFCPRSIMLYLFYQNNHPDVEHRGGQESIVHLVFNMMDVVNWAHENGRRWVFTDSIAGSFFFNDYCSLADIGKLDWNAIHAKTWVNCKEKKQAEFLVEKSVPWNLVREIGVYSQKHTHSVGIVTASAIHIPPIRIEREWYY